MKTKIIILFLSFFYYTLAFSQQERANIQKGNKLYEKGNYTGAETEYRESLLRNQKSVPGTFNLGNALYKQQKYDKAREQYQVVAATEKDEKMLAEAYHNIGNTYMEEKDYSKGIGAYKKALKLNPKDEDTRYNLALANAMLKQQQQQQQQQNNDDKKEDNKDQQEQQNQNQEQPQQQEQNNMSKENAQQILDAFAEDEKDLMEKLNEAKRNPANTRKIEKDW